MPEDCCFVGRRAYFYSHLLPAAIAYRRALGSPAPAVLIDDKNPPKSQYVQWITRLQIRSYRYAVAFDTWALIVSSLLGTRSAYLHHSLVGKGMVFKGSRPFWPLFLSDAILIPDPARASELPARFGCKTYDTGHLPMDWLGLDVREIAPELVAPLSRLVATARDSFTIVYLFTHGPFGAVAPMQEVLSEAFPGSVRAVRYHGYIPPEQRLRAADVLELEELPSPLAARHADLVLADHGSSALEAVALGRKVLCFESPALINLRRQLGFLSELRYLDDRDHVQLFRTPEQLRGLISKAISQGRAAAANGVAPHPPAGDRLSAFITERTRRLDAYTGN
jgi:hypothetical protein